MSDDKQLICKGCGGEHFEVVEGSRVSRKSDGRLWGQFPIISFWRCLYCRDYYTDEDK